MRSWLALTIYLNIFLQWFAAIAFVVSSSAHAAEPSRNTTEVQKYGSRIALVVGNSSYPGAPLENPVNDARDVAVVLRKLGFEVIERINVNQKDLNRAIAQFGEKLHSDTVALFYYAGHGMQIKGKNFLVPVDAEIRSEGSARAETVDVDTLLDQLTASPLNIVILDACRNNPFERRFRNVGGGLAQIDAPKGTLIAYATAPGKVASDGTGKNGLYTQELLKHIQAPGITLETAFKRIRNGVMLASGDLQTPWESSSLTGEFCFVTCEVPVVAKPDRTEELLKALEQQQTQTDRAIEQALLKANQRAQENQKATTDRAVEEALRKASEQALRERAELQKSMEAMLQAALAKQSAELEAQFGRKAAGESVAVKTNPTMIAAISPTPDSSKAASPVIPQVQSAGISVPIKKEQSGYADQTVGEVALSASGFPHSGPGAFVPMPGDEWEYATIDSIFGNNHILVMRVKGVIPGSGMLEEHLLDGKMKKEWAFDGRAMITGVPTESEGLFSPYWKGGLDKVDILGVGLCAVAVCTPYVKSAGFETISVPAGQFETEKLQIELHVFGTGFLERGSLLQTVWYSKKFNRVIKQTTLAKFPQLRINETIQLAAIRTPR